MKNLGCPEEYNCFTREVWSPEKTKWCCKKKNLGCPDKPGWCAFLKLSVAVYADQDVPAKPLTAAGEPVAAAAAARSTEMLAGRSEALATEQHRVSKVPLLASPPSCSYYMYQYQSQGCCAANRNTMRDSMSKFRAALLNE
mmetsp:Transcript_52867/g.87824  ORF Transcript_52867/g.87824 Transcript_52867/m.87824 type:complete len:141 (+) Transcript_52867:2-424(+)